MNKQSKNSLRIIPLEERVVFDAAIGAVLAQAAPVQNSAPIIYVNQNATGSVHDGSSWANAYLDLQSALAQAGATSGPEQVWGRQGRLLAR